VGLAGTGPIPERAVEVGHEAEEEALGEGFGEASQPRRPPRRPVLLPAPAGPGFYDLAGPPEALRLEGKDFVQRGQELPVAGGRSRKELRPVRIAGGKELDGPRIIFAEREEGGRLAPELAGGPRSLAAVNPGNPEAVGRL